MPKLNSIYIYIYKLKWLMYDSITSGWDAMLWFFAIPVKDSSAIDKKNAKIIMYVGEFLPPRIARLAKWCKKYESFTTLLICHKRGFVKKFSNEEIDQIILFRNKWHLKRIIRVLPAPYVMHGFAPKSKYPYIALQACKKYHASKSVIADFQDVFIIYYGHESNLNWLKKELPFEKKFLQYSDGLVANSLEPREGMRMWGIKEKKKSIFFPLYADNDYFCSAPKTFSMDDIHLVYVGGVMGSHRDKVHYGSVQFHWLIDYLSKQKIHFHIYPSPSTLRADYMEYEQIAKENPYFHFHVSVAQQDLAVELSKYHYGLVPFFKANSGQSDLKHKYATTLKLFNYLESGIPVLVGADFVYQSWLVERYKLGVVVSDKETFADLRKVITKVPYDQQVKNLLESREELSLKKHTPRLLEFYKSLQ
ncbi:MAG TPA: hypothetical protein VN922_02570 [Bacteroidia bacterium]|nr:hypothetical protein [Bacteroidia bacterium]